MEAAHGYTLRQYKISPLVVNKLSSDRVIWDAAQRLEATMQALNLFSVAFLIYIYFKNLSVPKSWRVYILEKWSPP